MSRIFKRLKFRKWSELSGEAQVGICAIALVVFSALLGWIIAIADPFGTGAAIEADRRAREECAQDCYPLDVARSWPGKCFCDATAVAPKESPQ